MEALPSPLSELAGLRLSRSLFLPPGSSRACPSFFHQPLGLGLRVMPVPVQPTAVFLRVAEAVLFDQARRPSHGLVVMLVGASSVFQSPAMLQDH